MIKKLLFTLLLISAFQVFAHIDYSDKLFSYVNSTGEEITVEAYYTDGIITADPVKLRVLDSNNKVIYEGEWVEDIIPVQESKNRWTVFEYESIFLAAKVIVFENNTFYESDSSLYSYAISILKKLRKMLLPALFFAILYLIVQKSIIGKTLVTGFFLVSLVIIGVISFPILTLFIYFSIKRAYITLKLIKK